MGNRETTQESQKMSIQQLRTIASILRKEETDFKELTQTLKEYEALVLEVSRLNMEGESNRKNIHFEDGKAIGSTWAAHCIRDLLRTKTFVKGIFKAIESIRKHKEGPIHIFYVGTGPFATLILPVMATYSPQELQVTLMEINPLSIESVNRVIDKLGFRDHIKATLNENATKYVLDGEEGYDICISETMQRALEREQQVPIFINILPQLPSEVIVIPEKVSLDLRLVNDEKFRHRKSNAAEDYCIPLGQIFELSRETVLEYAATESNKEEANIFSPKSFRIPQKHLQTFNQLSVFTEITVWQEESITVNQSALTLPLILEDLSQESRDRQINIRYTIEQNPGIKYELT